LRKLRLTQGRDMDLRILPNGKAFSLALFAGLAFTPATAEAPVSFEGKTIAIIVGSPPGGGTDLAARALANHLSKHIPGHPSIVINNIPGADGLVAMNSFVQRTRPDGLTLAMGSVGTSDPMLTRRAQSLFDPIKFKFVGGLRLGKNFLVIRADAEKRLRDKNQPPVIMGALAGVPRSSQQMAAWGNAYLDWNIKWVVGYRGTQDLLVALERGEIDMTGTSGGLAELRRLIDSGVVKILSQSGTLSDGQLIARMSDAPTLAQLLENKIHSKVEQQSFAYWISLNLIDKWLALPPDTPADIVETYREAYRQTMSDPGFIASSHNLSEEFEPQTATEVKQLIDVLSSFPPEAIAQVSVMLRKQGLDAQ
jgi:tripartite-type tricarboxylate transporter receptor subunit TctC